jgi:uncharacterized protein YuzB (UPF0349 family)
MSKNQQVKNKIHIKLTILLRAGRILFRKAGIYMRPIIEFCQSNLSAGTLRVMEELEKDESLDVLDYGCLGHCGECYASPYALVNGELIIGETPKDLLEKIREEIKNSIL